MEDKIKALVVYDISDNKRRNKCMKLLNSYGNRVQYSVYETHLPAHKFKRMKDDIGKLENDEDSIVIYRLNNLCNKYIYGRKLCGDEESLDELFF